MTEIEILNDLLNKTWNARARLGQQVNTLCLLLMAHRIRGVAPDARYVTLLDSDEGDYMTTGGVFDGLGNAILDVSDPTEGQTDADDWLVDHVWNLSSSVTREELKYYGDAIWNNAKNELDLHAVFRTLDPEYRILVASKQVPMPDPADKIALDAWLDSRMNV